MTKHSWKVLDILQETTAYFESRGLQNARLQAEMLLADVLATRRLDLYLQFDRLLTAAEVDRFREHVRKRTQRIPVQYIVGEAGFRDLVLNLDEAVLIPRPETEVLVGAVLDHVLPLEAPLVLDLGCGSGNIAVSVAHEHAGAQVLAVDVDPAAVRATAANATDSGVAERVEAVCGDLFEPLQERQPPPRFDAIASNPPYVRTSDIKSLSPEVRDNEPHVALDGGHDGLDFYRRIASAAPAFLSSGGILAVECPDGRADDVAAIVAGAGMTVIVIRDDLAGIPRVVVSQAATG